MNPRANISNTFHCILECGKDPPIQEAPTHENSHPPQVVPVVIMVTGIIAMRIITTVIGIERF